MTIAGERLLVLVRHLQTGDQLLRLGDATYPQHDDPCAPPVLLCEIETLTDEPGKPHIVHTSAGSTRLDRTARATVLRDNTVNATTVLLISRRRALHRSLLALGVPVILRNPLEASSRTAAVTAEEWNTAPLVAIDGYLSGTTLRTFEARNDIQGRPRTIMVGTDPDDASVYTRARITGTQIVAILPYDNDDLTNLFRTAIHG